MQKPSELRRRVLKDAAPVFFATQSQERSLAERGEKISYTPCQHFRT